MAFDIVRADGTRMSKSDPSEVPWERTAENLGSVQTDLSKRPLAERLRLLPSFQSMCDQAPDRVLPGFREAQAAKAEADRLARMPRRRRRAEQAKSRRSPA